MIAEVNPAVCFRKVVLVPLEQERPQIRVCSSQCAELFYSLVYAEPTAPLVSMFHRLEKANRFSDTIPGSIVPPSLTLPEGFCFAGEIMKAFRFICCYPYVLDYLLPLQNLFCSVYSLHLEH